MKKIRLTEEQARGFYAVHKERPFYGDLVKFMTSGPVVVSVLEGQNAIAAHRDLLGPDELRGGAGGHDPRRFRHQHRAQRRPRLGRGGDGARGDRLLLQRVRDPGAGGGAALRVGPGGGSGGAVAPRGAGGRCGPVGLGVGAGHEEDQAHVGQHQPDIVIAQCACHGNPPGVSREARRPLLRRAIHTFFRTFHETLER